MGAAESEGRRQRQRAGGPPRCSFCSRARGETSYLHEGPGWFRVCNGCIYDARALRSHGPGRPRRCSFCGADRTEREWVFGGSMVAICNECVDGCLEEIQG